MHKRENKNVNVRWNANCIWRVICCFHLGMFRGTPDGGLFWTLIILGFEFLLSFLDNLKYPIKWKRKIKKPCIKWDLFMSCVRIDWLLGVRFERTISHPSSDKDIHSQMGTQFTRFLGLVKFSDEQYTYPLFTNYWMLRVLRIPLWVPHKSLVEWWLAPVQLWNVDEFMFNRNEKLHLFGSLLFIWD